MVQATVSRNVRNSNGRFMSPTSSNRLDAHIPKKGIRSRIMAKNLLEGDRMMMRGEGDATIVSLIPVNDAYRGYMMVVIFRNSAGNVHTRSYGFDERVSIRETPRHRAQRRYESRLDFWSRYPTLIG